MIENPWNPDTHPVEYDLWNGTSGIRETNAAEQRVSIIMRLDKIIDLLERQAKRERW